jgi:hypothetical protein
MLSDVPNLTFALGYTNASWTLKCELVSAYLCRLLNHMDARSYAWCAARRRETALTEDPAVTLTSGYVRRAIGIMPKAGPTKPWKPIQNYVIDMVDMKLGRVDDGTMEFGYPNPNAETHAAPSVGVPA